MPTLAADTLPVWVALTAVTAVLLAAALAVPTAPPPDAAALARAVDAVAASDHPTRRTLPVRADAVRLHPARLSLRSDGGTATATLRYGPVVPASGRLAAVLAGRDVRDVFETPAAFRDAVERALARARTRAGGWLTTDRLRVRHVTWGDVDATLVG
ncbi:DUF7283 family protein [Halocalculus aciditolerans]|uniref:Uncharacterized protein n=1 Tax=Halocalculus aciditolerans TaxID=1383812 RepID=A0A830FN78_9EURY|nr:hypothetical protein [Halocalculus aciditolerans]GGL72563.1 hypothetical protein GCM10009039_33170 [Halocalculus aciditolerans]